MPATELERVVETTGAREAQNGIETVEALLDVLPWSRDLAAGDFLVMVREFREAAIRRQKSRDLTELHQLIEDWQATAEASRNRRLASHLADADQDTYVPWR